jgi:hypothetical protein
MMNSARGATVVLVSTTASDPGCTVRGPVPDIPSEVAVIVVIPVPTAVTSPLTEIVAMAVAPEVHVAVDVRSWVLPSL